MGGCVYILSRFPSINMKVVSWRMYIPPVFSLVLMSYINGYTFSSSIFGYKYMYVLLTVSLMCDLYYFLENSFVFGTF